MDGKCYGCATKFGFFTKEHSCHKCGHAYCKTCLPHKTSIPGKDPKKQHNVCSGCYKLLQQPDSKTQQDNVHNEGRYSPPENFKKRVAALKQREASQSSQSFSSSGSKGQTKSDQSSVTSAKQAAKYKNLAPQDRDIAMRLDKLQEERKQKQKPNLSEKEIEERLRKLRGLPEASESTQHNVYTPPPNKTLEEQYDSLLDQMSEEAALDARLEGREIPAPDGPTSAASSSHPPGLHPAGDPLLPSEDQLRQITDDAKKFLADYGTEPTSTQTPATDPAKDGGSSTSQPPGGAAAGGAQGEEEEEARRLAQEASRLMEAARAEVALDEESAGRDATIAARLAQLQNQQPASSSSSSSTAQPSGYSHGCDSDEDEEKASQRLIQQILAEDKLDENVKSDGFEVPTRKPQTRPTGESKSGVDAGKVDSHPGPGPTPVDPDELPWCCVCNDDAVLRCVDCEGDLYCKRCFREEHKDFGIESHQIKPYKPPNK